MAVAKGVVTFVNGSGVETQTFSWVDVITGAAVTFGSPPTAWGPFQEVTTAAQGPGVPYGNGLSAITTTGGTITMANPPDCTVVVWGMGT